MSRNLNEELGQGRRFTVVPTCLITSKSHNLVDQPMGLVILSDYTFWMSHYDELQEWCNVNGGIVEGMTVMVPDEKSLLCFLVRWS